MKSRGVMEIFYGHPWSDNDRLSYAKFLKDLNFQFYIYGPKADECLRKNWRKPPTREELARYQTMRKEFAQHGLRFGMVLSPHGLDGGMDLAARHALLEKVKALDGVGLDFFGLFFDDMKSAPELAEKQLEIVHAVQSVCKSKLVFCPSFYCHDPLLDMLFGDRPPNYLDTLGRGLADNVEVLWTGESIISHEVSAAHLKEVSAALRRKPFMCDNFYADDGPLNCNFLRLVPPTGRERSVFSEVNHWSFNPMNQAHLSKIILSSLAIYIDGGMDPAMAFERAVRSQAPQPAAEWILEHASLFATAGLDGISEGDRSKLRAQISRPAIGPVEGELLKWLDGHYAVDFASTLDQSCLVP